MLKPAANNLNPSPCAPFSVYDEYPELPTAIKQAEQGATARAMADFTRRTTRLAFVIALGLLLLSLALSAAMGFRAVTRSQANYLPLRLKPFRLHRQQHPGAALHRRGYLHRLSGQRLLGKRRFHRAGGLLRKPQLSRNQPLP